VVIIWLKTLPIAGPSRARIIITTTDTNTRINAYSTRPCPFSFGANNMEFYLLSKIFPYEVDNIIEKGDHDIHMAGVKLFLHLCKT